MVPHCPGTPVFKDESLLGTVSGTLSYHTREWWACPLTTCLAPTGISTVRVGVLDSEPHSTFIAKPESLVFFSNLAPGMMSGKVGQRT